MPSTPPASPGPPAAAPLDRWGRAGVSYPPSPAFLDWLAARLGATSAWPGADLARLDPPAPRDLPPLPCPASVEAFDRLAHSRGRALPDLLRLRSGTVPALPDAVARPADTSEVERLLVTCSAVGARVIPWGGGTSVTGGVNVPRGDAPVVVVDLTRLAGLAELDETSRLATFGAGTRGPDLERALAARGLTLGHFPQSFELSTLGGWIATRASGQESMGYGSIQDLVAGLDLVAPGGRLRLPALPASAAGPDLRHLVLGSEGRFGIVTRAVVRVRERPAVSQVAAALLPSWGAGLAAARELVQSGVPLTLLRLSDETETEVAVRLGMAHRPLASGLLRGWLWWRRLPGRPCLLLAGGAGGAARVEEVLAAAAAVVRRHGGVGLGTGAGRKWLAERFLHPYLRDELLDLGIATETLETAAPWSRLEELGERVRTALAAALDEEGERVPVLCHVSHPYRDGASLYFTFFFRCPADPDAAVARWARLKRAGTAALVTAGGTVSHHHGVGRWHAPWLEPEVGATGLGLLRGVAGRLDPAGILNPGALLDVEDRLEE